MRNLGSIEILGLKCKYKTYAGLCLKLRFESNWYFSNITESRCFWKRLSRSKVSNNQFLKSVWKKAKVWTVIFNQSIKYQLPHTRFNQISDRKHDIYLYGTLSSNLLARPAHVNTKCMFTKYWTSSELLLLYHVGWFL